MRNTFLHIYPSMRRFHISICTHIYIHIYIYIALFGNILPHPLSQISQSIRGKLRNTNMYIGKIRNNYISPSRPNFISIYLYIGNFSLYLCLVSYILFRIFIYLNGIYAKSMSARLFVKSPGPWIF